MVKRPPHLPQPDDAVLIPDDLQTLFGRNLRAVRLAHKLKQQDLADRAGFKSQYISRVEGGQINLTLDTMKRLATALGQDVRALLRPLGSDADNPASPKTPR